MSMGLQHNPFFRFFVLLFLPLLGIFLALNFTLSDGHPALVYAAGDPQEKIKLDVPFEPSEMEVVWEMLKIAQVKEDDVVYDLGCGDGRVVIAAAKKFGARGVGVDIDPQRIRESLENARKAGVTDRVKFYVQDLFQADIREATVLMLYLWPEVNLRLRPKLFQELKPGTRVVSHSHDMGPWEADRTFLAQNGHQIHFWIMPANVSGTWEWEMAGPKGKEHWVLKLQQKFQKVRGTLHAGPQEIPLTDLGLKGDWL